MFKRIGLFMLTNILVIATISIVLHLLGVRGYITEYGIDYTSLMIFCLVWGLVGSFISLMMSKFMAKTMMGVKILEPNGQYGWLVQKVHNMAKAAGLPKVPEVGIYQSPEINAFATGPSRSNSLVAVSSGLLSQMSEDEIEGVLGHEVAHIANGDMVTMTLIQGVINAFVMFFARIASFAIMQAMRRDSDSRSPVGGGMMQFGLTMLFQMLFGILGMMVVAYFSRYREFRADVGGARIAGRDKMIAALKRLQQNFGKFDDSKDSKNISAFKISSKAGFMALLSTHPPLEKRIKSLEMGVR